MVHIIRIPAFTDNYIWLITDQDMSQAYVVDPGDADAVIDTLNHYNITLSGVLITHYHPDHIGGLTKIYNTLTTHVYGPKDEDMPVPYTALGHGDSFETPELSLNFQVFSVPGHTLGHIVYYSPGMLFCGDTLFAAGCGRLFEGTPEQMVQSLLILAALPPETVVYCAHEYTASNLNFALAADPDNHFVQTRAKGVGVLRGEKIATVPSSLRIELQTNPFLRYEDECVRKSVEQQTKTTCAHPVDAFAALRRWKDRF